MLKNKFLPITKRHNAFFYTILAFNLILVSFTRFYPSMDGPSHLYNSNVIYHLLKGNEFLEQFYSINSIYIPNWTSHFLLSIFRFIFPAFIAEKALLLMYIAGMALSFRYLIKTLNPENIILSVFIFPFIYSFLFHLGFYNYCISFIFFFLTTTYWIKYLNSKNKYSLFLVFCFLTIAYFSNALTFNFLGLTLGLFVLLKAFKIYSSNRQSKEALVYVLKKLGLLLLISLPCLVLFTIFLTQATFFPSNERAGTFELIKWLNDARPFIVYDYHSEEIITEQYLHLLIIIIVISFYYTWTTKRSKLFTLQNKDVFLLPFLLSLVLLFIIPSGWGAGMMSDRFSLFAYMMVLIWVLLQKLPKTPIKYIALVITMLHIGLALKHHYYTLRHLDEDAKQIVYSAKYIQENSTVLPVNLSDNWIEPHFSNYLGVEKPMVILENYEANVAWFPVKWNEKKMPVIDWEYENSPISITWPQFSKQSTTKQIDYIFIYGGSEKLLNEEMAELRNLLKNYFTNVYLSDNNYIAIYKRVL